MKDNYPACLATVLKYEGGWSDNPSDPGGQTMKGVTQAVYDAWRVKNGFAVKSVRDISDVELESIYRQYWMPINGDMLALGVDLVTFDAAVNSGVSRAKQWLASSIGGTDLDTIHAFCAKRLSFMQALRTWSVFGNGWGRRVADVEARAVKMASGDNSFIVLPQKKAQAESAAARARKAGKSAAGGAITSQTAHAVTSGHTMLYFLIVLGVALGVTAFIMWRNGTIQAMRAKAFGDANHG